MRRRALFFSSGCRSLPRRSLLASFLVLAVGSLSAAPASAATAELSAEGDQIHAGLPFVLALSAKGFEEEPAPAPPELAIAGAETTYLGVSPNVSTRIEIVNGRRSDWREVTFVYRWRVLAASPGQYVVPSLTVEQNGVAAVTQAAKFTAQELATSTDMRLSLKLPDRPVWPGETFDVTIEWLLRRDVEQFDFAVPLFDLEAVQVAPGAGGGRTFPFPTRSGTVQLPALQDQITEGGETFTRLAFPARITALQPGALDIGPVRVAARVQVGTTRDAFGFRRARTQLALAEGKRQRLVVRALPETARPPTFVNAIGTGYAIDVSASRTVVGAGEPIELTIRIGGDGALDGLSLPNLHDAGLPAEQFTVLEPPDVGQVDASTKTFDATVRVMAEGVREIPAIAFSWFDPVAGEYRTARSRPVALSVGAGEVVGVTDVATSAPAAAPAASPAPSAPAPRPRVTTGADMTLSDPAHTLTPVWSSTAIAVALALLYALPLLVLGARFWAEGTGGARRHRREVATALARVEQALAASGAAHEGAPAATNAMRTLARLTGHGDERPDELAHLETEAFDPVAGRRPIDSATADGVRAVAQRWAGKATAAAVLVVVASVAGLAPEPSAWGSARGLPSLEEPSAWAARSSALAELPTRPLGRASARDLPSPAESHSATLDGSDNLATARAAYAAALDESAPAARQQRFAEAQRHYGQLAQAHPSAPELLADWGNAAIGAGDTGTAVLAYRRALLLAPGHDRATRNLATLRSSLPDWLPRPQTATAIDSLLFWRGLLSPSAQLLLGGALFAIGILLLAPWPGSGRRAMRGGGAACVVLCAVVTALAVLTPSPASQAVVTTVETTLHTADSRGAPALLPTPLPAGTELTILERREGWSRIALADGADGWVTSASIESLRQER